MAGLGGGRRRREPSVEEVRAQEQATAAQERAEERAESQERTEMRGVQARRRLLRRGGLRLLFSPARQEGPGMATTRMLGGGS
jgi:hypothetical protein